MNKGPQHLSLRLAREALASFAALYAAALHSGAVLPAALALAACSSSTPPATNPAEPEHGGLHPDEKHFKDLVQLTDGGENAEAYWSNAGNQLIFQAHSGEGCDQIYTMPVDQPLPEPRLVSTGKGATTCAYFLPGDSQIIYSSTHLAGDACPPAPDRSKGYVWPLYPSFDIFKANADGSAVEQLTNQPGYDAEATVCRSDGSIIFTSTRDGDLELYRMDQHGQNVQRLTNTPGYDGGAFFSADCSKIVWRASRPTGKALEDYQQLLAEGLVRPTQLELYVANADGTDARQITYLGAAAFAPFFTPDGRRVLFSSNTGDPSGREFDIWAVNVDGTQLERITRTPGFDGFPMFSPDGKLLAFSSNRASRPGTYDTNVFVTEWVPEPIQPERETAADRTVRDIAWLADPAREGRGVGTAGLTAAGEYIEQRFKSLGLQPLEPGGSYRQELEVVTRVKSGPGTKLSLAGAELAEGEFMPAGFSGAAATSGRLVLAGYGVNEPSLGRTDYEGVAVKGNIAVVRRFVPESDKFQDSKLKRTYGDLRQKAWVARERGATALLVVDMPERPQGAPGDWAAPDEAAFPLLERDGYGDAGIPVLLVKRAAFAKTLAALEKGQRVDAKLSVELSMERAPVFNVLGRLPARAPADQRLPGAIVIGAHYDHLGYGGSNSLAPGDHSPHVGADDNASGVALVLEVARSLSLSQAPTRRDIVFATFTAEEMGILGSSHLVKNPPSGLESQNIFAMLNFDMVGRLTKNSLSVLGAESAIEWASLVPKACEEAQLECHLSGSGYGPSDHSAFYTAGIPVLHFFTGAHPDYHKPSDQVAHINGAGVAQIASLTERLLAEEPQLERLSYRKVGPEESRGDVRSFNASLGTIPDYAGPPDQKGVLLSDVRPGSGAAKGGMQRGDVLVQLGDKNIESVQDLMFTLNSAKPHQTVTAVVLRGGKRVELKVTYQERGGGGGQSPHGQATGSPEAQGKAPAAPTPGAPAKPTHP
ncbi:MAG TPA: M20/M25/M40 family metallo-hydrolase [Polyangiaceae bacterium]|nr:M20/M25/M40 family metallo-hydrolase [Polyangiaceae bacterium]